MKQICAHECITYIYIHLIYFPYIFLLLYYVDKIMFVFLTRQNIVTGYLQDTAVLLDTVLYLSFFSKSGQIVCIFIKYY